MLEYIKPFGFEQCHCKQSNPWLKSRSSCTDIYIYIWLSYSPCSTPNSLTYLSVLNGIAVGWWLNFFHSSIGVTNAEDIHRVVLFQCMPFALLKFTYRNSASKIWDCCSADLWYCLTTYSTKDVTHIGGASVADHNFSSVRTSCFGPM